MDEEEMAAGGQNQLFTILLVNSGRLAFPDYTVQRLAKVFRDREDLIRWGDSQNIIFVFKIIKINISDFIHTRYEASMRALVEVTTEMQGGQWERALELYSAAKTTWCELRTNQDLRSGPYRS